MTSEAIAFRSFYLGEGESREAFVLRIFAPHRETEDTPFGCRYTITMGETVRTMTIFGEDSLQALLLAMSATVSEVKHLARKRGLKIDPAEFVGLPAPFRSLAEGG